MSGHTTIRDALRALADGFDRGLTLLEESDQDTVHVVLESPEHGECLTIVLHSDGSYGLSFPAPPACDPDPEEDEEDYRDAGC